MVRFGINYTGQSQSDCTDRQWFQGGCNKEKNVIVFERSLEAEICAGNLSLD